MQAVSARDAVDRLLYEGRVQEAVDTALANYARNADSRGARNAAARALYAHPEAATPAMRAAIIELLRCKEVDPDEIAPAGWLLAGGGGTLDAALAPDAGDEALHACCKAVEADALIGTLLREAVVTDRVAEEALTRLRRWLLLSGRAAGFPDFVAALAAQAALNEGAWLFEADERARLDACAGAKIVETYLPRPREDIPPLPEVRQLGLGSDSVTAAVAQQYEHYPYPPWRRITWPEPQSLRDYMKAFWPEGAGGLPDHPRILIAGCGTGRQAATWAVRLQHASITAIDISRASLAYARKQCIDMGIANVRFIHGDLRHIAELGETFDVVVCGGVLQHLPDPERGWAKLLAVLAPGGVMSIAVYSKLSHMPLDAACALVADLASGPLKDEQLREARRRILKLPRSHAASVITGATEFYSLTGIHDILYPASKYLFDIPRLARAHEMLGLRFLGFKLPASVERRYDERYPQDARRRDLRNWQVFEQQNPLTFFSMYQFFCCRL